MIQVTVVCDLGHSRRTKLPNGICIHLAINCNENAAAEIQNQQEIEMQKRQLGNSDLQITPVGYGAWAIGGSGWQFAWGSQSDGDSIAAIHRALELGVNWIDTAAVYGLGHSEEVVARALKEWSGHPPYVFTKCGMRWDDKGQVSKVLRADSIRREVEDSLRRLKLEVIDLYQIHWPPDPDSPELEEGWSTMADLKREGKVRWIGVSNLNVKQIRRAKVIAPVTSVQPPYSLIHREVEEDILPYCLREGIGVIVYSPMASGLLTGAMTRERAAKLPKDDWRSNHPDFQEPRLSQTLGLVEKLREIGNRHGRSPGEVAIAWTLRNPAVTGAIVGARNARQANGVMRAGELRLSDKEVNEIEEIADEIAA
jgi:aryl-alcohol dehydrogenase-like predicted oxidoreductase